MPTLHRRAVVTIRHWLPIITYCPVNGWPDLLYVSLTFVGENIPELYSVREKVRALVKGKRCYMEDIAMLVHANWPRASKVEVRLAFDRHVVTSLGENI